MNVTISRDKQELLFEAQTDQEAEFVVAFEECLKNGGTVSAGDVTLELDAAHKKNGRKTGKPNRRKKGASDAKV